MSSVSALTPAVLRPAPRPRRRWPRAGLLVLGVLVAAVAALALPLNSLLPADSLSLPLTVVTDGEDLGDWLPLAGTHGWPAVLLAGLALLGGLAALMVLPVAAVALVLGLLGVVAVVVLAAVGLPVLAVMLVLGLLLSPLLLLGALLWWLLS